MPAYDFQEGLGALTTDRGPRLRPLSPDDVRADVRLELDGLGSDTGDKNVFYTLAHHPGLLKRWLPFCSKLMAAGKLPGRLREVAIVRTAARCRCEYELSIHRGIAAAEGLNESELASLTGLEEPGDALSDVERHVVAATDQLIRDHRIDADTWSALGASLDRMQVIELTMLVGHYVMLAGFLNSAQVEPDTEITP